MAKYEHKDFFDNLKKGDELIISDIYDRMVHYCTVKYVDTKNKVYIITDGGFNTYKPFIDGYGRCTKTKEKYYIKPCTKELKEYALRYLYRTSVQNYHLDKLPIDKLKALYDIIHSNVDKGESNE